MEDQVVKKSLYLETTVVSYYVSRSSRDVITLAHQEITKEWWNRALKRFNIFISEVVLSEAGLGDHSLAEKRLQELKNLPLLELTDEVEKMARIYIERLKIPPKALRDAAHLAIASVHNIDYLVTWNCVHIANGEIIKQLLKVNEALGIKTPVICTPEGLMYEH
jgi:predicted nucleic acid-binding protein